MPQIGNLILWQNRNAPFHLQQRLSAELEAVELFDKTELRSNRMSIMTSPTLPGYELQHLVAHLHGVSWWRGESTDKEPVLVEYASSTADQGEALAWLRRESEIVSALNLDCTMRLLAWVRQPHGAAIVYRDQNSTPLSDLESCDLKTVLTIATQAAHALAQLHGRSMIHGRLSPEAIWFDSNTDRVEITDLSRAAGVVGPGSQRWTIDSLRYASPEHTGRVGRQVDHRSDLYSFGAILYGLLTGNPLFDDDDIASLIHAHLARTPIAAAVENPKVPAVVSRVLERLLQKSPENRYQSTEALANDLQRCLKEHVAGIDSDFTIGASDRDRRLKLSDKLYGRAAELDLMCATAAVRIHLVTGKAGIGKSALVADYGRRLVDTGARVAYGKFEQYRLDVLHGALSDALRDVTRQLLSETDLTLLSTRQLLSERLGSNAPVLFELIPELCALLGTATYQEPVELGAAESTHRFGQQVLGFLECVVSPTRPLVLVLDDLQWAGVASLGLLELILLEGPQEGFHVVVPCRGEAVAEGSPVADTLAKLTSELQTQHTTLAPLQIEDVQEFLVDSLGRARDEVTPLARLVHQHSKGNPFVVRQLIHRMHSDGLLTFDERHRTWVWDLEKIPTSSLAGGIVEIVADDIGRLTDEAQDVLRLAACMGSTIEVTTLATVIERPIDEVDRILEKIAEALFIQPAAAHETATRADGEPTVFVPRYTFRHDRIQQAAYSLVPVDERPATHLRIGRLLQSQLELQNDAASLIQATEQLNAGRDLIDDPIERQALAQLNLAASTRARLSTSWLDAKRFIEIADELVDEDSAPQILLYEVRRERAFVEFLNGDTDSVRKVIHATLPTLDDPLHRATLLCQLVVLDTATGAYADAIAQGRRALQELDISLPKTDLPQALENELGRTAHHRAGRSFDALAIAPVMTDPIKKLAVRILVELDSPTFLSNFDLYAVVVSKMVSLSLEHGPVPESSKAYASFGIVLGPKLGRYEEALRYNQLGIAISERFGDKGQECRACHTMANHNLSWRMPVRGTNAFNERGYQAGYQAGEILWCGYIQTFKVYNRFFEGRGLRTALEDAREGIEFCRSTGNRVGIDALEGMRLTLRTLSGETSDAEHEALVAQCTQNSSAMALGLYLCVRAEAELVAGRPARALALCDEAEPYMPNLRGIIVVVGRNLVESLAALSLIADADECRRTELMARVEKNQNEMRAWADSCPSNFECRWLLVEADRARVSGDLMRSSTLFDESAAKAEAEGFTQIEAFGHERQALLWAEANKPEVATVYRRLAQQDYQRWGAKTGELSQGDQPELEDAQHSLADLDLEDTQQDLADLDLEALMKAARALSGELQRERLPMIILKLMVVVSGAEWGHLILDSEDGLRVEATTGHSEISETSVRLADHDEIAERIVRFVFRSGEDVILSEACSDGPFTGDPCVVRRQIRSLLAVPLTVQGETRGVLYLTNELVSGAFGASRVSVLRMLLAQAAVSLSNAELFARIEEQSVTLLDHQRRQTELAETKLAELRQKLVHQTRLATIGQWTASIAHEIRNPLGAVRNAAYFLKTRTFAQDDPKVTQYLDMIDQEINSVERVIASMLQMVRAKKPIKKPFDLSHTIQEVVKTLDTNANIKIELLSDHEPFMINADHGLCRQVIVNLVTNAIQAVNEQGKIRIETKRENGHDMIFVQDSGPGINEELRNRLFEPLFTTKAKGTGLGLTICREIIQLHDGTITVEESDTGALFCVRLPQ